MYVTFSEGNKKSQRIKYKAKSLGIPIGKKDSNLRAFLCKIFSVFWGPTVRKTRYTQSLRAL